MIRGPRSPPAAGDEPQTRTTWSPPLSVRSASPWRWPHGRSSAGARPVLQELGPDPPAVPGHARAVGGARRPGHRDRPGLLQLDRPTVSPLVKRLEATGHPERHPSDAHAPRDPDRRRPRPPDPRPGGAGLPASTSARRRYAAPHAALVPLIAQSQAALLASGRPSCNLTRPRPNACRPQGPQEQGRRPSGLDRSLRISDPSSGRPPRAERDGGSQGEGAVTSSSAGHWSVVLRLAGGQPGSRGPSWRSRRSARTTRYGSGNVARLLVCGV